LSKKFFRCLGLHELLTYKWKLMRKLMLRRYIVSLVCGLFLLSIFACNTPGPTLTPSALEEPTQDLASPVEPTASLESLSTATTETVVESTDDPIEGILPAPLYYISAADAQIWRMEIDGLTVTQITFEPLPVDEIDVSAASGQIAYISGNALYAVDSFGAGRTLILEGLAIPENYFESVVTAPRWSPDGSQLAFGFGGINIYEGATGTTSVIKSSDPYPDLNNPNAPYPDPPPVGYAPLNWSPDGTRLLVTEAVYYSEGFSLVALNPSNGDSRQLISPDGLACCNPAWSPDGTEVIISNESLGLLTPGMWQLSAASGEGRTLVQGYSPDIDTYYLVSFARKLTDGNIYGFFSAYVSFPETPIPLQLTRFASDGSATPIGNESYLPADALWSPDDSGVIVVDLGANPQAEWPYRGPLVWVPIDGSLSVRLEVVGRSPRWGKP
jgi:hypothetical protein